MIAYVHKSTSTNGGPVAVAIAVVFVVLCIGLWVCASVKRRSVRRQLVSDADQYAPMLANEPVPSAHEWRPLSGAEASPGVLIPPWLGGVPDQLPAAWSSSTFSRRTSIRHERRPSRMPSFEFSGRRE